MPDVEVYEPDRPAKFETDRECALDLLDQLWVSEEYRREAEYVLEEITPRLLSYLKIKEDLEA